MGDLSFRKICNLNEGSVGNGQEGNRWNRLSVEGTVEVKSFEVAVGSLISCRSCSLGLVAFTFIRCGIVSG